MRNVIQKPFSFLEKKVVSSYGISHPADRLTVLIYDDSLVVFDLFTA